MASLAIGDYLLTATFPDVDGVAKDAVQWKFAFHVNSVIDSADWFGFAASFFNSVPTGSTNNMGFYLAHQLSRVTGAVVLKLYNITGALGVGEFHGTPIAITSTTIGTPANSNQDMPAQCALVLATNAAPGGLLEHGGTEIIPSTESAVDQGAPSTHVARARPLSRSRGRMFLGPWNVSAIDGATDNVIAALGLVACHAAVDLIASSAAIAAPWSVWSKVDSILRPVAHGYCETKFGTQRRRREFQPPRVAY